MVAATTRTSQARTPVPVGRTTRRAAPSAVPPASAAAAADACSAVRVGVVVTVSPGKTRPRTPVTRSASVLAPEPRPEKTSVASSTGTSPTTWPARVVVTWGTVTLSGSSKRRAEESAPNSSAPYSSMNSVGAPGQEPPERSLR